MSLVHGQHHAVWLQTIATRQLTLYNRRLRGRRHSFRTLSYLSFFYVRTSINGQKCGKICVPPWTVSLPRGTLTLCHPVHISLFLGSMLYFTDPSRGKWVTIYYQAKHRAQRLSAFCLFKDTHTAWRCLIKATYCSSYSTVMCWIESSLQQVQATRPITHNVDYVSLILHCGVYAPANKLPPGHVLTAEITQHRILLPLVGSQTGICRHKLASKLKAENELPKATLPWCVHTEKS